MEPEEFYLICTRARVEANTTYYYPSDFMVGPYTVRLFVSDGLGDGVPKVGHCTFIMDLGNGRLVGIEAGIGVYGHAFYRWSSTPPTPADVVKIRLAG